MVDTILSLCCNNSFAHSETCACKLTPSKGEEAGQVYVILPHKYTPSSDLFTLVVVFLFCYIFSQLGGFPESDVVSLL